MAELIYLVVGNTGEYEDFREWAVAAFTSKQRAETWKRNCEKFAPSSLSRWSDREDMVNPYDPDMDVDYNGVRYNVCRVRLNPAHPTAAEIRAATPATQ